MTIGLLLSLSGSVSPRTFARVTGRPVWLRAAVAPSATTTSGSTSARSISFHQRQRSIS